MDHLDHFGAEKLVLGLETPNLDRFGPEKVISGPLLGNSDHLGPEKAILDVARGGNQRKGEAKEGAPEPENPSSMFLSAAQWMGMHLEGAKREGFSLKSAKEKFWKLSLGRPSPPLAQPRVEHRQVFGPATPGKGAEGPRGSRMGGSGKNVPPRHRRSRRRSKRPALLPMVLAAPAPGLW